MRDVMADMPGLMLQLNNCCGHFSPLKEDTVELKEGDVAKMCVHKSQVSSSETQFFMPPQDSNAMVFPGDFHCF